MNLTNSKIIKVVVTLLLTFGFLLSVHAKSGLSGVGGGSECEVSVSCGPNPNDYVRCSSDMNDCERDEFGGTVTCDGITTSC